MYVPKPFQETRVDVLHGLIRANSFGTLVTCTVDGIDANHIPFILNPEPAPLGSLQGHVARANPVWCQASPDWEALVLFHGPAAYVSPGWYPAKRETGRVTPTWNYAVVHAYGPLQVIDDPAWLRAHVEALTEYHEAGREDSWRVADAPAEFIEGLVGAIVGIQVRITRLIGKWKVSQNRPAADREAVAAGLRREGTDTATAVAELVRDFSR